MSENACPACGDAMRYSDKWKMWSCPQLCVATSGPVLKAIERRQAALVAEALKAYKDEQTNATSRNATRLADHLARELFESGDEPRGACSRIQCMVGVWPAEVAGGGYAEKPLARFLRDRIVAYKESKKEDTHED